MRRRGCAAVPLRPLPAWWRSTRMWLGRGLLAAVCRRLLQGGVLTSPVPLLPLCTATSPPPCPSPPLHCQDLAEGKAQVVQPATAPRPAAPPSRLPRVVRPSEQQVAAMRKALLARQPLGDGGGAGQQAGPADALGALAAEADAAAGADAAAAPGPADAAAGQEGGGGAATAPGGGAVEGAAVDREDSGGAPAAGHAAAGGEGELAQLAQQWQAEGGTSSEDMPDLPIEDD